MIARLACPWLRAAVVPALLALLTPAFGSSLIDALDTPTQPWIGTPGWEAVATAGAHDGVDAAQVTSDDDDSPQRLETMVTGPGYLTLWWQILPYGDDEGDIFVEVDGIEFLDKPTNAFAWEQVGINLPAGTHSVAVILRSDGPGLVMMVDQASWHPGQQLPAAVAMGDPDGMWIQTGEWQRAPGEARDGTGDAARLQYSGARGEFVLKRLVTQPGAVARHWRKIATATPDLYVALFVEPFSTSWTQITTVVAERPWQGTFLDLSGYANEFAAPATVWYDDLEIIPLTLAAAVDLPSAAADFPVTATTTWRVSPDEADFRRTGSVEANGSVPHVFADMHADFNGPGLLTWSWRKWADYDESITVSVNGAPLGVFTDDMDSSSGFAHIARVLTGGGTNSVLWHLQWGDNPFNPIALDDVLFSPPAPAGLREAMEINSVAPLYATSGIPWTSQSLVTHDGTDALELPVAGNGSRAALTFPVTGPGILTWWWRSDLPDGTAFRLHRQGRQARTLSGNSGWRQEFLALRAGEEFVRWEVFPGGTPATLSHRVWLDEVSFVPQAISIAEAVDAPGPTWLSTGNALAAALPAPESHDGTDALVITASHNRGSPPTWAEATFTGPGSLSFWLHTRHGPRNYGYTWEILVDGSYRPVHPPDEDEWTAYAFPIPAGTHTVRWVPNTGCVMTLDDVTWTPGDGYALWAQAHISPGQPAGLDDDPDRDGLSNLLEYGFSTDPLDPRSSGAPNPALRTLATGRRVLEFVTDVRRTDIRWEPEISSDLTSWQRVPAIPVSRDGFLRTMHAELPDTRGFARVSVVKDW